MSTLHHIAHRTKTLPPLRVGIGGPQPAEVQRQLQAARQSLKQDEAWLQQRLAALAQAEAALNASMSKLANP